MKRPLDRQTLLAIVAGVVLVAAVVGIFAWGGGGEPDRVDNAQVYLYDLDSGELSGGSLDRVPGVQEEPTRVWARVFTCGKDTADERFVGYLERFGGELKSLIQRSQSRDQAFSHIARYQGPAADHQVRAPDGGPWVPANSEAGQRIVRQARARCSPRPAKPCFP